MPMNSDRLFALLEKHLPAPALLYCFQLWEQHPFDFKLRKRRISKVGDFSCRPGKSPCITINNDSQPYLFLITYIHEVAHLRVHQMHGWRPVSHGKEWKTTFQQIMEPMMRQEVFPAELLKILQKHMANPKASSFSDSALTRSLRQHDENQKAVTLLSEIPEGSTFSIHGRWFKKGPLKRTRVLCHEIKTRRNFLVPADAPIEKAQPSILSH